MNSESWVAGRRVVLVNWRDRRHPQAGGAEVYIEQIAAEWARAGADVTLLAARVAGAPRQEKTDGFTVRRGGSVYGVYLFALAWLFVHRRRIDAVIDCQNGIPFFAPLVIRRRIPVVQVIHHVHQEQFDVFFGRVGATVGRLLEGPATRAVYGSRPTAVVSPSTRRRVRQALRLEGACLLVPNGLTAPPDGALRPRSEQPTIVCVGRLMPQKRADLLLQSLPDVLRRAPALHVHFVGDGQSAAPLRALADQLGVGDAVTWHGYLPADRRDAVLAQAWLTVNLSAGEGWGLGVMEAASFGVPALGLRVDGIRDSVRPTETGWLLDDVAQIPGGIADALEELQDPGAASRFRKACLAWAARFTWPRTAGLLDDVVAAEAARLARPRSAGSRAGDRRDPDRPSAVVEIPQEAVLEVRRTDVEHVVGSTRRVLLYDADPRTAAVILRRSGIAAAGAREATGEDLLLAASSRGDGSRRG